MSEVKETTKSVSKETEISSNNNQKLMITTAAVVLVFVLGGITGYLASGSVRPGIAGRGRDFQIQDRFENQPAGIDRGMMGNRPGGFAGRSLGNEVAAIDGNKITVKLPSGNTTTITVNDSTVYKTITTGTKDSIKVGSKISVSGTDTSSDSAAVTQITVQ
jgi:hypothetical protein